MVLQMALPSIYVIHDYDVQLSTNVHSHVTMHHQNLQKPQFTGEQHLSNVLMYCYLYIYLIHTYTSNLKVIPFCNLYGS